MRDIFILMSGLVREMLTLAQFPTSMRVHFLAKLYDESYRYGQDMNEDLIFRCRDAFTRTCVLPRKNDSG